MTSEFNNPLQVPGSPESETFDKMMKEEEIENWGPESPPPLGIFSSIKRRIKILAVTRSANRLWKNLGKEK